MLNTCCHFKTILSKVFHSKYNGLTGFMKRILVIIALLLIASLSLVVFKDREVEPPQGKLMSVESYVSQNISELSPEKEVLGGKFYVTDIQVADGKGVVSYEDGHVAFTADFTYTSNDRTGHTITSFVVR